MCDYTLPWPHHGRHARRDEATSVLATAGLKPGELRGVALHELDGVLVGQVLEGLDDLGVAVLVVAQQARLDVLRVQVLVHVTHPEGGDGEILVTYAQRF